MSDYRIIDDGDELQVHLTLDASKIGTALLPEDVNHDANALVRELGEAWKALS